MLFDAQEENVQKNVDQCIYCQSRNIVKKGLRKKKHEEIQVYFCKHCEKKFTPSLTRNKTFPLRVILDCLTLYNRFYSFEKSAKVVGEKYSLSINPQNIRNWLSNYAEYLPYSRMREFIAKKYQAKDIIAESQLFHGQIYEFKYHRAKTDCILEDDFKHFKFKRLQEFLELIIAECPHQIFRESKFRASEYKDIFNLDQVRITPKDNMATKNAKFVLEAVANNKLRHEILQEFMLVNDSVTVATEVPILLSKEDIVHFQNELAWQVPLNLGDDDAITGHIDIIQIRNGMIHIMDYKPSAHKVKPIEQLTIYALALSRLTSLRLFHFKAAWFDSEHYYEFYPLHVVMKKAARKKKIIAPI